MCGRYIANTEDELIEIREILKQISIRFLSSESNIDSSEVANGSDIYPSHRVIIINKTLGAAYAKWGIVKWDKKGIIINARSENLLQSGFFKPFVRNRCIIPAHGYYEWQTSEDKGKVKYALTSKGAHGIFMAGIYKSSAATDEFAVITRPAEQEIKFIHDRMPMIIKAEQAEAWLGGEADIKEIAREKVELEWERFG